MKLDVMLGPRTWGQTADLARDLERHGFSGMVFTETSQAPWMNIAAASLAAPTLELATGISVAFARSPMVSAGLAWELAENTQGRFRLGLGSQVRAHIERRFGMPYTPAAARMRDYLGAFQACIQAFRGEKLDYQGRFYQLNMQLSKGWAPPRHDHEDIRVDISAVGPMMTRLAGELCDGIHVHPLHSMHYIRERLLPSVAAGAAKVGRDPSEVDLIIPVFAIAGDSPEERAPMLAAVKAQIAFYGSTRNYAFQFEDLGFTGVSEKLNERLKAGDPDGMAELITDEMIEHYALIAPWDEMGDALQARYRGTAARVVLYLAAEGFEQKPEMLARWGEIARAVKD
ncbi:MAG TPA: TIGR03617 family F420-dependent LLM class oxidoreductase [Pseudonocardia sp.]